MILSAIAAMARNRAIGIKNGLPWNIPEDMKYFRDKTRGKILIMGRKTFESLPGPLPGRMHIVISRQSDYLPPQHFKLSEKDYRLVKNLFEAVAFAKELQNPENPFFRPSYGEEVFVIGGAEIYKESLPLLKRIYLTVIEADFEGDAFFPEFDTGKYRLKSQDLRTGNPSYDFRVYEN